MAQRKWVKRLRRDGAYIFIRLMVAFFRILPRKPALLAGSLFGRIAPLFVRKDFRLAKEHLALAFGGEKSNQEIENLARDMFRNLAMNFVDTARLNTMTPDGVKNICIPHNFNIFYEKYKEGKGVIGLTGHVGCWELMGTYFAMIGINIDVVAQKLYDSRLERLLIRSREEGGMKVISRGENTRDILHAIRDGHLIGMLIDQDMNVKGEFVDFFGRPAYTASAPALLSLRYKVPILPIFTYRDRNHNHHICVGEPLVIEPTGITDHDIKEITALCSKATESFIRKHPDQWVWFHRRWKTSPDDTDQ